LIAGGSLSCHDILPSFSEREASILPTSTDHSTTKRVTPAPGLAWQEQEAQGGAIWSVFGLAGEKLYESSYEASLFCFPAEPLKVTDCFALALALDRFPTEANRCSGTLKIEENQKLIDTYQRYLQQHTKSSNLSSGTLTATMNAAYIATHRRLTSLLGQNDK